MYPASLVLKGRVALNGTEAEQHLANFLLDENVQVLSSFELNQIASLTYGEMVCDQIFELLEEVLSHPVDHSTLSLLKALAVTKHVLIYGSEKSVNSAWVLGRYVNALQEYNTVLILQQRQGPDAWWQRVKGGGVDTGFPVREAATDLQNLLSSKDHIQLLRHTKADPNSLVPIGDDKVAFASDEVRHYILKKRLEEQKLMHTKSNLAKERGGFGSGLNTKDGKAVVGAAHSLEEMMARAKREERKKNNKFSDDGPIRVHRQDDWLSTQMPAPVSAAPVPGAPGVDLLDLSTTTSAITSAPSVDPFAMGDLLGGNNSGPEVDATSDLLSLMTVAPSAPPVADLSQSQAPPPAAYNAFQPVAEAPTKPVMGGMSSVMSGMSSNVDRFAALDALTPSDTKPSGTGLSALEAQNQILGSFNFSESNGPTTKPNGVVCLDMSANGLGFPKTQPFIGGGPMASAWPPAASTQAAEEYLEPNLSTIAMGAYYGNPALDGDDEDNGFVMGGAAGSGLEPTAASPAAAPPPPPPAW
jgi:hypothetical protein